MTLIRVLKDMKQNLVSERRNTQIRNYRQIFQHYVDQILTFTDTSLSVKIKTWTKQLTPLTDQTFTKHSTQQ